MTSRLIRGRLLSFEDRPSGPDDTAALFYESDGGLWLQDGVIRARGPFETIAAKAPPGTPVTDHRPHLVMPGLIDTHLHMPQMQVIASWAPALLEWLNTHTFPAETRFADPVHAARIAGALFDELLRHGTTTALAYCSVHSTSAEAFFAEAARRRLCMIGGKVMMDRNAPKRLTDTAENSFDESAALIERWHGIGRLHYAITPRFAITSTPSQLEAAGALKRRYPECYLQTHLSENAAEIALTAKLYPKAADYFAVYEQYGLTGPKALFGHCLHLNERERSAMAETGSVAVFCPTSNLFLGSGVFDMDGLEAAGLRTAIATDIGGGTSYSMLRTLDEGYKVLQLQGQRMDPLTAFYRATLGNARALGLEDRIGTLAVGSDADIAVFDPAATPAMALRHETVGSLADELFLLQTLGDDRSVAAVYVAGDPVDRSPKPGLTASSETVAI
ncbi:MAG: guanine deaminase [Pseudomonadota bacterium]